MFLEVIGHSLKHAFEETWLMALLLIFFYIVIELLEQKVDLAKRNRLGGAFGPLFGSVTGLVPQCGFSVMAAKLFEKRYITVGTLMAIFMATSDEAFLILFTKAFNDTRALQAILPLILIKVFVGIFVGYTVDGVLRLFGRKQARVQPIEPPRSQNTVHDIFIGRYLEDVEEGDSACACGRVHETGRPFKTYVVNPVWHAIKIIFVVFAVSFLLTAIIEFAGGEEVFSAFMQKSVLLQPILTALIGLIPNCASSAVITQTYLSGGIAFGSLVAGLCANAGLGFFILLRNVKKWRRNLLLLIACYWIAVVVGWTCNGVLWLVSLV